MKSTVSKILKANKLDLLEEPNLTRLHAFLTKVSKINPHPLFFDFLDKLIENPNFMGKYKRIFLDETAGALLLLLQKINRMGISEEKEKVITAVKDFLISANIQKLTWINSIIAQSPHNALLPLLLIAKQIDGDLQKDFIVKILHESENPADGFYHFSSLIYTVPKDELETTLKNYENGRKLARRLVGVNSPIISLNFAYALSFMAEEIVVDMYEQFGVRYFLRYSKDLLLASYETWKYKTDKPVVSIHACYDDWNGAFYFPRKNLDGILKGYAPIISEGATKYALYDSIKFISSSIRYTDEPIGKPKLSILMGHGTPRDILFGNPDRKGKLSLADEKELMKLRKHFAPELKVVLVACSTGEDDKAIGAIIARAWQAHLFAPTKPDNISKLAFDPHTNLLINVNYLDSAREFNRMGVPVRLIEKY